MLDTGLEAGCKALATYSSSFGVPYSLPKLDLVCMVTPYMQTRMDSVHFHECTSDVMHVVVVW